MNFLRSAPKSRCFRDRPFRDRSDAGRQLATALAVYASTRPTVLGLLRGGIPVAHEVARALHVPVQALMIRKLGAPYQRELGVGAIAQGGLKVLNHDLIARLKISEAELSAVEAAEREVLNERLALYALPDLPPDVQNKTVIVVDDGLATGITMQAAVETLKKLQPFQIIVAVPVGTTEAVRMLSVLADEVVCLWVPEEFNAVGEFYEVFDQVSDQDVMALLHKF